MLNIYEAVAYVEGSEAYPALHGTVKFFAAEDGSWVEADIANLPPYRSGDAGQPQTGPFGFHIHENSVCGTGSPPDPFAAAGAHWNPGNQPHGNHAGDFPALFASANGTAKMLFYTDRFKPSDVIGKTIVIHRSPDDYRTQPSGNSGERIGCGTVVPAVPYPIL